MPNRRPRGYQPQWKPRARTCGLLAAVDRVLARYVAQLPLTIRQVWYSLISDSVLVKEERTYKQTVELLGMARRSGRIPWEALRDDTEIRAEPVAYDDPDDFRAGLRRAALDYRLDRQVGQPVRLETAQKGADMALYAKNSRCTAMAEALVPLLRRNCPEGAGGFGGSYQVNLDDEEAVGALRSQR
ncbi:hypothetical protein ACFVFJ_46280 [Streptomyces sp. NPDC057717]|uniref:hypothetical protein n=1 Tax=Streptomyces sp. NPDC057717 TaxID=3346224 RepID=UPI0036CADB68